MSHCCCLTICNPHMLELAHHSGALWKADLPLVGSLVFQVMVTHPCGLHYHFQPCTGFLQDQLLKIAPQQQQVQYHSGTPVDLGVRVGTGLLVTLVVNKLPLLAAGSLCFPLWWPIYKAWWQNQKLRSQYRLPSSANQTHFLYLAATLVCHIHFLCQKIMSVLLVQKAFRNACLLLRCPQQLVV